MPVETTIQTSTMEPTTMSTVQQMDDFLKNLLNFKQQLNPTEKPTTTSTSTTTSTTSTTTTTKVKVRAPAIVTRPGRRRPIRPRPTPRTRPATTKSTTTQLDIVELLRTLEEQKRQEKQLDERFQTVPDTVNSTTVSTATESSTGSTIAEIDKAILYFGAPEQERIRSNQEVTEESGKRSILKNQLIKRLFRCCSDRREQAKTYRCNHNCPDCSCRQLWTFDHLHSCLFCLGKSSKKSATSSRGERTEI